jgi:hypothetical protein
MDSSDKEEPMFTVGQRITTWIIDGFNHPCTVVAIVGDLVTLQFSKGQVASYPASELDDLA